MKWYVLIFGYVLVRSLLVQGCWSIYMSEEDSGTRHNMNKEYKGEDIKDLQ